MATIKILIFDTETSGLPKSYKLNAEQDLNNYPYLLQYAANILEVDLDNPENNRIIANNNKYVIPFRDGKEIYIEPKAEEIHKISFNKCNTLGEQIEDISLLFQGALNSVDLIVAHNYTFDRNVLVSEMLRLGLKPTYKRTTKILCTMKYCTNILKLKGKNKNQYKFPTLEETFKHYVGDDMVKFFNAHDANQDVQATTVMLLNLLKTDGKVVSWLKGEIESIY